MKSLFGLQVAEVGMSVAHPAIEIIFVPGRMFAHPEAILEMHVARCPQKESTKNPAAKSHVLGGKTPAAFRKRRW